MHNFIFKIFTCLCSLLLSITGFTQNKVIVRGTIEDLNTGERLIGVNVYNEESNTGSASNKFGFYSIYLTKTDSVTILFSYVGYNSQKLKLAIKQDTVVNISLLPNLEIAEVQVISAKKIETKPEMSKVDLSIKDIRMLPTAIGETDVLKAYQLMPGIQGGLEGSSGLYVRGGSPDQNLFLLDDVPLYNVSHMGGFVSVFDISVLKKVDFYKGGYPARYGGKLSSIVDIRLKDGNIKKIGGEYSLGTVLTKIMLEGPISKDKSSFILSVRRCNFDLLTFAQSKLFPDPLNPNDYWGYNFYDLNLKLNYKVTNKDRLFVSSYVGNDNLKFITKEARNSSESLQYSVDERLRWGNKMFSTRWNHIYSNALFHNISLSYSQYKFKTSYDYQSEDLLADENSEQEKFIFLSGIKDLNIKIDYEFLLKKNIIRTGIASTFHNYTPTYTSLINTFSNPILGDTIIEAPIVNTKLYTVESSAYFELQSEITDKLQTNIGTFLSLYNTMDKAYFIPQPRILFIYNFIPSCSFKASFCKMQQYTHLLTNSGAGLPTDLWIPSTSNIKPEISNQIAVGLVHTSEKNIEISFESYYKKFEDLIEYKAGTILFQDAEDFANKIELGGTGSSKGIELLIQKKSGIFSWWIAYTLSKSERRFENLNNGKSFPFKYDRLHDISLVGNWIIKPGIKFSATWVYTSGYAITLPTKKYQNPIMGNTNSDDPNYPYTIIDVHIYNGKNRYRMPSYHRLDIGFQFSKHINKGERTWSLGVYNVYNKQNAYFVYFKQSSPKMIMQEDGSLIQVRDKSLKLYQMTLMPIFPYCSYSLSF
ncbi:MAG: TonB-dependent receptor [Bacteroidales bacterium]|nr:TonB-dependent receptor [Bacteroidales bacterium]MBN2819813.1 TonB-dependent receptor [Bacteroidales bacterium]